MNKYKTIWILVVLMLSFYSGRVFERSYPPQLNSHAAVACERERIDRDNIMILINEYRLENGLPMWKTYPQLHQYAQARADYLHSINDITHDNPFGTYFDWQRANLEPEKQISNEVMGSPGELLSMNHPNACSVLEGWKNSPTHNAGLLDEDSTHVGVGINESFVVINNAVVWHK